MWCELSSAFSVGQSLVAAPHLAEVTSSAKDALVVTREARLHWEVLTARLLGSGQPVRGKQEEGRRACTRWFQKQPAPRAKRIFTVMHWKQCSAQSGRCSRRLEYSAQYETALQPAYSTYTESYTSTQQILNNASERTNSPSQVCLLLRYEPICSALSLVYALHPRCSRAVHFVLSGVSFVAMRPKMGRL